LVSNGEHGWVLFGFARASNSPIFEMKWKRTNVRGGREKVVEKSKVKIEEKV